MTRLSFVPSVKMAMATIDLRPLAKALKRLKADQGPRAGRNARAAATAALRKVKKQVSEQFPPPPRVVMAKQGRPGRRQRMVAAGWRPIAESELITACALAGVPCKRFKVDPTEVVWVPNWVVAIGPEVPQLRRAKTDLQFRRVVEVRDRLLAQSEQQVY